MVVVDDDPGSLELLSLYLSGAGVQVAGATTGADGLALARRLEPAAIILDIRLPDVEGWELMSVLRSDPVTTGVPLLVVSVVDERARGLALGAVDYLVKPVGRDAVLGPLVRLGILPVTALGQPLLGSGSSA